MRVIAGTAKGLQLKTLDGLETRPTIDRVKEGIFSAIQFIIPGAAVLDLFAGSGQMGLEALSRGAAKAVFVDENRAAVDVVIQNLKAAELFTKTKVLNMQSQDYLNSTGDKFDIVFLDPPYNKNIVAQILPKLLPRLADGAVVFCETELNCTLPENIETLVKKKTYKYGKVSVTKYVNMEA